MSSATYFASALLGIALLCMPSEAFAAERGSQQQAATPETQEARSSTSLLRQEIALLKSHNAELRSIVIWSLTFVGAFLISFLALVGYLTVRRYDQEKESLRALLEGELRAATAVTDSTMTAWRSELSRELSARLDKLVESISPRAKAAAEETIGPIRSRISSVSLDVERLKGELLRSEAEQAEKHPAMAVTKYFYVAEHAFSIKDSYSLSGALEKMEQLLKNKGYFTADEKVRVTKFLDSLPAEFSPLVAAVKNQISSEAQ